MREEIKGLCGWGLVVLLGLMLLEGCASQDVTTLVNPAIRSVKVERIGVMPFFKGRHPTNVKDTLRCTLCDLSFDPNSVAIGSEHTLTRYVQEELKARFGDKVIPLNEVRSVYERVPKDEERDTPITLTRKAGRALGANLMLLGTVWRYRERMGSPAGATRPASVAFDLYLVDVKTGDMLWMANYDETQKSLSENVLNIGLFFRRGAKWLTANEMARYGVKEALGKLPL